MPSQKDILEEIANERVAQDVKWGEQNHPIQLHAVDVPSAHMARFVCDSRARRKELSWADILLEEFCEVVEAAHDNSPTDTRTELVQLAAVCVAAVECLDRRANA